MANSNRKLLDLTGQVFGRLTVLGEGVRRGTQNQRSFDCLCVCGNTINVKYGALRGGHTQSCGCAKRDAVTKRNTTHGLSSVPEYGIWCGIIKRCENRNEPAFNNYGKRGIAMCPEWRHSFERFYADMGTRPSSRHTVERRDNNEGYSAKNCYWATRHEQAKNKRNNRWLTFNGETLHLTEWARRLGTVASTISARIDIYGWTIKQTLTTPIRRSRTSRFR